MTQTNDFAANAQEFEYPKLLANIRLKLVFSLDIERYQPYHSKIQELQAQVNYLNAENLDLKTENSNLRRINQELQWRIDPNSSDGDAICNSDW
ncbi:MAG: hypothetical protein MUE44_19610 [Oscillatoriaceae cyanobacterium Prado104]|jgi:hypothetical protein|nr:hypothetical protein [Oscillatoriaceae cyanobacterium Prado104]